MIKSVLFSCTSAALELGFFSLQCSVIYMFYFKGNKCISSSDKKNGLLDYSKLRNLHRVDQFGSGKAQLTR